MAYNLAVTTERSATLRGGRVEAETHIPLSPSDLWELMRDVALRPHWDATVRSVVREDGDKEGMTTRLYYVAPLPLGFRWSWEGEYASFQPPHTSSVRMMKGSSLRPFKSLAGTWILRPDGEGTLLRIVVSFEPRLSFPFWRPVMTCYTRTLLLRSLHRLRMMAPGKST